MLFIAAACSLLREYSRDSCIVAYVLISASGSTVGSARIQGKCLFCAGVAVPVNRRRRMAVSVV